MSIPKVIILTLLVNIFIYFGTQWITDIVLRRIEYHKKKKRLNRRTDAFEIRGK